MNIWCGQCHSEHDSAADCPLTLHREPETKGKDVGVYYIRSRSAAPDETVHSVMCMNELPLHKFEVFGIMAPATPDAECTVVQRILEHMDNCTPGHKIEETVVTKDLADRLNPIYKLIVRWVS